MKNGVNRLMWWLPLLVATTLFSIPLWAQEKKEVDFELEIQAENRYFFNEGLYPEQERNFLSIAANPEWDIRWNDGDEKLVISLFVTSL